MMREQTLVPCFASRFSFIELTFGRMPILTRWSRTSTFQIVSARLSKNSASLTSASDASFSRRASNLVSLMSQRVERLSVSVLMHDHYSHAGNCTGLPSNTCHFPSTSNKNSFLFQRHLSPFESWPQLLFRFSSVWRQRFVIGAFDKNFFSPLFSIFDTWASISFDASPCRTFLIRFLSWSDSCMLNMYRLPRTTSDGIFDIDNRISSHLVPNSWTSTLRRVIDNKWEESSTVSWAPVTRKQS